MAAHSSRPGARDTETPKGTWTILLGYAAVIAALWGYMYLTMLLQR